MILLTFILFAPMLLAQGLVLKDEPDILINAVEAKE